MIENQLMSENPVQNFKSPSEIILDIELPLEQKVVM